MLRQQYPRERDREILEGDKLPSIVRAMEPALHEQFPNVDWDELDHITPSDFTVHTAVDRLGDGGGDPWAAQMPAPQRLPAELIEEGHAIPVARVQAMHEGKRRRRAQKE